MSNLNITLRPLILLPLVTAMLTACGGGSSSSSSTGSTSGGTTTGGTTGGTTTGGTAGGATTNDQNSFTSTLTLQPSNGAQRTINSRSAGSSGSIQDMAYSTASLVGSSNTVELHFYFNSLNNYAPESLTVSIDPLSNKILSIKYENDSQFTEGSFDCGKYETVDCLQSTVDYNPATGQSMLTMNNQKIYANGKADIYATAYNLNGKLVGKLAKAPLKINDINQTSSGTIVLNNQPINILSGVVNDLNYKGYTKGYFEASVNLGNNKTLFFAGKSDSFTGENQLSRATLIDGDRSTYISLTNANYDISSINDQISIQLKNASETTSSGVINLSGNIILKKPTSSIKINDQAVDQYFLSTNTTMLNHFLVNNFTLESYPSDRYTDPDLTILEDDFTVIRNGSKVIYGLYEVNTYDVVGLANTTEYSCGSTNQLCEGITFSNNGNQINYSNTKFYADQGTNSVVISGSFNTQGR